MKYFSFSILILIIAANTLLAQNDPHKYELPELGVIKTISLSPSYSCRTPEAFQKGYEKTAIWLFSNQRIGPDLLFNGACGSEDYFEASLAGDDFSLIADLGTELTLEEVSAARAFNPKRIHNFADYSKFARVAKVQVGHVYAVILNNSFKRGLFVFRVDDHIPNQKVGLRYAVKNYQAFLNGSVRAEGFDWEKPNN